MPGGMPIAQGSSAAWASMGSMWSSGFNSGWVLDQQVGSTGGLTSNISAGSSSTFFFSTGDALAFYLPQRLLRIVQGGSTIYGEVISSSSSSLAGTTTTTVVTIAKFLNSSGLSTGVITSVSASVVFPSTGGGAGNMPNSWAELATIKLWGL